MLKDKYSRTFEQIKCIYDFEKEWAKKLIHSSKDDRQSLYNAAYDELYQFLTRNSLTDGMVLRKSNPELKAWVVNQRLQLLDQFLKSDSIFLEVGPGDCSLSIEVAKQVKKVYAVDVTRENVKDICLPENLELIISDGSNVLVPEDTVDIAYSHQLMEHLHPDDAKDQLRNLYKVLAPGGSYICITPNRLSGPHDISHHFDEIATCFHLKEYTVSEMYNLFREAGFTKINYIKSQKKTHIAIPLIPPTIFLIKAIEVVLEALPYSWRRKVAGLPLLFRGMTIVGIK